MIRFSFSLTVAQYNESLHSPVSRYVY